MWSPVPIFKREALRELAEAAGHNETQSGETIRKANKRELTLNRLQGTFPDEALHAQLGQ
jgi:hypothetical protein